MWQKVVDFSKQMIAVVRKQQEHEDDIKELRDDNRELRLEMG